MQFSIPKKSFEGMMNDLFHFVPRIFSLFFINCADYYASPVDKCKNGCICVIIFYNHGHQIKGVTIVDHSPLIRNALTIVDKKKGTCINAASALITATMITMHLFNYYLYYWAPLVHHNTFSPLSTSLI